MPVLIAEMPIWGAVLTGSLAAALMCLVVLLPRLDRMPPSASAGVAAAEMRFLLDGEHLVDADDRARRVLGADAEGADWESLRHHLSPSFSLPPDVPSSGLETTATNGRAQLVVDRQNARLAVSVRAPDAGPDDVLLAESRLQELVPLRATVAVMSDPVWMRGTDGSLIWANPAFHQLARDCAALRDPDWPPGTDAATCRLSLTDDAGEEVWLELRRQRHDEATLFFGTRIDAIVRAEVAQRNFVQTLTKTFAHLPIGLAIFDRNRQLALFNPALIDLTALPAEFLSARPNLMTFFDQLREAQMMPEPKNYNSWREQLADLVKATCDDRYAETWTLPSGLTYKVTGRPHPDGAIAFLIEDISAEISLTRRFRAELMQYQALLDGLEDAVAVFSQMGILVACNLAYRRHWGSDPDAGFNDATVTVEAERWRQVCSEPALVEQLRKAAVSQEATTGHLVLTHKSLGRVRAAALAGQGGTCLVRFVAEPKANTRETQLHDAVA